MNILLVDLSGDSFSYFADSPIGSSCPYRIGVVAGRKAEDFSQPQQLISPGLSKPMGDYDFGRVEDQLQCHLLDIPHSPDLGDLAPDYLSTLARHVPFSPATGVYSSLCRRTAGTSVDSHLFQSIAGHNVSGMSDIMTSSIYSSNSGSTLSKPATSSQSQSWPFLITSTMSPGY